MEKAVKIANIIPKHLSPRAKNAKLAMQFIQAETAIYAPNVPSAPTLRYLQAKSLEQIIA